LETILTERSLLLEMGVVGRRRAERYYTQKILLERYHQLYTNPSWTRHPNQNATLTS